MASALQIEVVPLASLRLDPANVRTHSQRNIDVIAGSLREFGQRKPIVLHGNTVIAGNGTVQAARSLGWSDIDAVRVPKDWDDQRIKAFAIADNRAAELAAWDEEALLEALTGFSDEALLASGFTDMDIKALEALYGEIPEGFEGRVKEPSPPVSGRLITLHVDEDTWDRWQEAWVALDGDDSERLNALLDVLP